MLRMHQCKSVEAAESYYTRGLSRGDYYVGGGQELPGRWRGNAAALLGLTHAPGGPDVRRDSFVALCRNRHPENGERLTLRTKGDRTVGYDLNFHAPKGVSLLHALHGDPRILESFRDAVDDTMRRIEEDAACRVRKHGAMTDRLTANLAWGEFVHLTARPTDAARGPDPHLHAHCFVFNATFDHLEEAWKAGQFMPIVRDAPYYEALFHARFALGLEAAGYRTARTATGWDLARIPRSLAEKFSTRTREIEGLAEELGITDPEIKAGLGARTRKAKDDGPSGGAAELRARWDARLTDDERTLLRDLDEGAGGSAPGPDDGGPLHPSRAAEEALDWAIAHCFERRSALPRRRLIAEALRCGVGRTTPELVEAAFAQRTFLTRQSRGQEWVTVPAVLNEEARVLEFAVSGRGSCPSFAQRIERLHGAPWTWRNESLSAEQQSAVSGVLASPDRLIVLRGAAGVGKTTMAAEAVAAIRAAGYAVVTVAPTAAAARGPGSLRERGFPSADTVAKLLTDARQQKGLSANGPGGGLLWVDEAGLLGSGTLAKLLDVAAKHQARVVLCGDARQHKPVERGDALRVLERLGGVTPVELTTIRRQRGAYREAVQALSEGRVEAGVDALRGLGAFHQVEDEAERRRAVAADYVKTTSEGKSALVVSPTHAEGRRVAEEIRRLQREQGVLKGPEREIARFVDTGWTEAQRRDPSRYEEGLIAHFHQATKGVVAGDRCRVKVKADEHGQRVLSAVTPRGVEIPLPLEAADRFQVYREEKMKLAVGDLVRITRNGWDADRRARLTNGMVHTVTGFDRHGAVRLDGGRFGPRRIMPARWGHLDHGAVMTSHAAQGKDVDRVIVAQSSASFAAASMEQLYVSVSRGKSSVALYTDDVDGLIDSVRRSAARLSASELAAGLDLEEPSSPPRQERPRAQRTAEHHARQRSRAPQKPAPTRSAPTQQAPRPPLALPPPTKSTPKPPRRPPGGRGPEIDRER